MTKQRKETIKENQCSNVGLVRHISMCLFILNNLQLIHRMMFGSFQAEQHVWEDVWVIEGLIHLEEEDDICDDSKHCSRHTFRLISLITINCC